MLKLTLASLVALMFALPSIVVSAAPSAKDEVKDGDVRVIASCNDGTDWRSRHADHRGACSGHGGVKAWKDGSPIRAKGTPLNPPRK